MKDDVVAARVVGAMAQELVAEGIAAFTGACH